MSVPRFEPGTSVQASQLADDHPDWHAPTSVPGRDLLDHESGKQNPGSGPEVDVRAAFCKADVHAVVDVGAVFHKADVHPATYNHVFDRNLGKGSEKQIPGSNNIHLLHNSTWLPPCFFLRTDTPPPGGVPAMG